MKEMREYLCMNINRKPYAILINSELCTQGLNKTNKYKIKNKQKKTSEN